MNSLEKTLQAIFGSSDSEEAKQQGQRRNNETSTRTTPNCHSIMSNLLLDNKLTSLRTYTSRRPLQFLSISFTASKFNRVTGVVSFTNAIA